MLDLNTLFQELNNKNGDNKSIEIQTLEENEVFRISIGNSKDFSMKDIFYSSFKGICFQDSINEEVYIYKSGDHWEVAKHNYLSDNSMEYWIEKRLRSSQEFYEYILEECIDSESYRSEEWMSNLELPDLYDLYEMEVTKLLSRGWILAYQYLDVDLIDGELHREIYYRENDNNSLDVIDVHPPEGKVSDNLRKFTANHTRWDIDSSYSWKDFYTLHKERKSLDQNFEIETKTKSELKLDLEEKEDYYGLEILVDIENI